MSYIIIKNVERGKNMEKSIYKIQNIIKQKIQQVEIENIEIKKYKELLQRLIRMNNQLEELNLNTKNK